jgi:hypothetical protein
MGTNITDQQQHAAELQLSEPHFDEEATLLSARPVVPLCDIPARGVQRRLVYGFTILVAVMAGAFAATLVYKQRSHKPTATTVERNVPTSEQAAAEVISSATGTISDSPAVASPVGENVDTAAAPEVPNPASPPRTRKPDLSFSSGADTGGKTLQRVEDHRIAREMRRSERIEARRLRRSADPEATKETRHNGQSARDLLRIREIFEGSPRP